MNALDVTKKEPVEYVQTYNLLDQYTTDTTQSHQCRSIAPAVQQNAEFKVSEIGGEICEDGQESSRCIYICSYSNTRAK